MEWATWLPAITAILGFIVSGLLESWRDMRAAKREEAARTAKKRDDIEERRARFQRKTLLALQQALTDWMRARGQAFHHDRMASKGGAPWGRTLIPESVDTAMMETAQRASMLRERVQDESTRKAVEYAMTLGGGLIAATDEQTAAKVMLGVVKAADLAQKQIGKALRSLDEY